MADVDQAQAQLETARTQAADIALQRAQTEHAIAVLIGENPSRFHLDSNPLPTDAAPPRGRSWVAVDVARAAARCGGGGAASRRGERANRCCPRRVFSGVQPRVPLQASIAPTPRRWLNAPSRLWSVGPQGLLTVFDAGRHRAEAAQAHAQYDEQVADYRNTVLTAYQEVEDNLAALHRLEEESISESAAVTATGQGTRAGAIPLQGGAGHLSRGGDHRDHGAAGRNCRASIS